MQSSACPKRGQNAKASGAQPGRVTAQSAKCCRPWRDCHGGNFFTKMRLCSRQLAPRGNRAELDPMRVSVLPRHRQTPRHVCLRTRNQMTPELPEPVWPHSGHISDLGPHPNRPSCSRGISGSQHKQGVGGHLFIPSTGGRVLAMVTRGSENQTQDGSAGQREWPRGPACHTPWGRPGAQASCRAHAVWVGLQNAEKWEQGRLGLHLSPRRERGERAWG